MKSHTTERFRTAFLRLPVSLKKQAREAYKIFLQDPSHPSLQFKRVHPTRPVYSVRITRDYRAVGVLDESEIVWFWIGSHREYEKLIARL